MKGAASESFPKDNRIGFKGRFTVDVNLPFLLRVHTRSKTFMCSVLNEARLELHYGNV